MAIKRISVYVDPEKYRILKAELAYDGVSVSGWTREKMNEYLRSRIPAPKNSIDEPVKITP